ncbi:hypothetical protein, partial [Kineosporia sp. NBRC 101731]|uniref:hypothetical protein n=1 Tax=Kineosporia sp. NBRC 101731 TaxID=3032199 RepID=UPI0025573A5F
LAGASLILGLIFRRKNIIPGQRAPAAYFAVTSLMLAGGSGLSTESSGQFRNFAERLLLKMPEKENIHGMDGLCVSLS